MCGICGLYAKEPQAIREERTRAMVQSLRARGPDASDIWSDAGAPITLGHARLSILDLSPAGAQPMMSSCKGFVLTYNGEIYNFRDLRSQLTTAGRTFRGNSDSEVLVEAVALWGVPATLQKLNGMFAFAVWDIRKRRLWLCRDRLGIKPVYYGTHEGQFIFASELKALRAGNIVPAINRQAVAAFLQYSYVPAPLCIYDGMRKLLPGHLLTVSERQLASGDVPAPEPYWQLSDHVRADRLPASSEYVLQVEEALSAAVSRRLVADVPLGAFLSGGIDSSLIVACMQRLSSSAVKTFSIGFRESEYNEAQEARRVAEHLGTDHTELYLTADDALAVIPRLASVYDEPFADSSQIPTLLVSALAAEQVTVCLSGDGGDELFCGYNRYLWSDAIWRKLRRVPRSCRALAARLLQLVPPRYWDMLLALADPLLPSSMQLKLPAEKIAKLCRVLDAKTFMELYTRLVSHWEADTPVVLNGYTRQQPGPWWTITPAIRELGFIEQMMYMDTVSYLPDDLLTKVDRASMAESLEVRVPFLDHTLVELAWQLPVGFRVQQQAGLGKVVLQQILGKSIPPALFKRPKMGFSVPVGEWLRGPLRAWADDLLDEKRLESQGLLAVGPVREKWAQHLSLRANCQYYLWDVLMLQSWLDSVRPARG